MFYQNKHYFASPLTLSTVKFYIHEIHEKHEKNKAPKITLIKSFWKSRNLFSKRFLAAGGKSDAEI
jgi:hypothetical protein